jgi:hypothetical protein
MGGSRLKSVLHVLRNQHHCKHQRKFSFNMHKSVMWPSLDGPLFQIDGRVRT